MLSGDYPYMFTTADKSKYYAKMQIDTSAKPRLICMLHEKCVQLIRQHLDGTHGNSLALLVNAQNILAQLERSLKQTDDVSEGLFYLYDYCYCQIEKSDTASLNAALKIMISIRDTFEQLGKG